MNRPACRIAVTGLGVVTPHADSVAGSWTAWREGVRAGRFVSTPDIGFERVVRDESNGVWPGAPAYGLVRSSLDRCADDPVVELALRATSEAVANAQLRSDSVDGDRVGCVYGTSKGGLYSYAALHHLERSGAANGAEFDESSGLWRQSPPSIPAVRVAAEYGWRAAVLAPVAACATGLVALIRAAALIRDGVCDVALAGSSDASLHPAVLGSFRRLRVLAGRDRNPAVACRPFDAERCGFIVGEGAAALVLERWDHAVARGTTILAEWVDGLERGDPEGLTVLPEDAAGLARLIQDLLLRSEMGADEIDVVSLHGTGTRMNDTYEAQGVVRGLGSAVERASLFGLKGGMGHLLGAAGSVETIAAVCALRKQRVPPTVNCDVPAKECRIPLVLGAAESRPVRNVLKLSLGFGGHLAAAILRSVD